MRLVPLLGAVVALAALPAASVASHGLSPCGNEDTFVVAVYVKGGSCEHAFTVLSRWRAEGCAHRANPCKVAYHWGGHIGYREYHCQSYLHVDHKGRHYYAVMCLNHDHTADIRARDYPRGDWRPD